MYLPSLPGIYLVGNNLDQVITTGETVLVTSFRLEPGNMTISGEMLNIYVDMSGSSNRKTGESTHCNIYLCSFLLYFYLNPKICVAGIAQICL